MSGNRFAFWSLGLALIATGVRAQISVGPSGVGPLTFDSTPPAAEFSTGVLLGAGPTFSNLVSLNARVATVDQQDIIRTLPTVSEFTPTTYAGGMRYNSQLRLIQSRPATSSTNAAGVLLGRFVNNAGHDLGSVFLAYSFAVRNPVPGELPGLYAYWSLTGSPNSWQPIPELSATEVTGVHLASINLGNWTQGSVLYILWADDNANGLTDPSYTIDDLSILISFPPPIITAQPQSTNVITGQAIRLSVVVANGLNLQYRWFKDGSPLDPLVNPTATQSTLIITNAQITDAGTYYCTVSDFSGGAVSDSAAVTVSEDITPPTLTFAHEIADNPYGFRLTVSEPLCTNASVCGSDASWPFNWVIESTSNPATFLSIATATISGTNIEFLTDRPRGPGLFYRIRVEDFGGFSGVADRFGNRMPPSSSIPITPALLFKQGINGYTGTQDTEIHSGTRADNVLGAAQEIRTDLDDDGIAQALVQFGGISGLGPGQLNPSARVVSATLSFNRVEAGSPVALHRMLSLWDQSSATWNGFTDGISADNIEAGADSDAVFDSSYQVESVTADVTASVRAWLNGQPNHGWVLRSTGTDSFVFSSSESANPPSLTILYDTTVVDPCFFGIQQQPGPTITFIENQGFALSATLSSTGLCLLNFQWTKDGVDIPGATSSAYFVNPAGPCHAGTYHVRISDAQFHSVTSNPAIVTMSPDVSVPVLTRALASADGTNIMLTFSKPMERTRAEDTSNYILDPPVAMTGGSLLSGNPQTVILTTGQRDPLVSYRLRVRNLAAQWWPCGGSVGNVIVPNPTIVDLTGIRADLPWNTAWFYSTNSQDATLSTPSPWYASDFALTSDWKVGQGLFGTETSPEVVLRFPSPIATPISPEPVTSYFRRPVNLPALPDGATRALCLFIDDGAIFYLDGVEIGRVNMTNSPPVVYAHHAANAAEATLLCLPFTASPGLHTLAVEVHQAGATSSPDLVFGLQILTLTGSPALRVDAYTITWRGDSHWELVGAPKVDGPFAPLSNGLDSPLGTFNLWPSVQTNASHFYRLRFHDGVR